MTLWDGISLTIEWSPILNRGAPCDAAPVGRRQSRVMQPLAEEY